MSERGWWQGLWGQALLWIVLPMTVMLAIAIGAGLFAYQQAVQSLVKARDQELARVSAGRLSENMRGYADILLLLANSESFKSGDLDLQKEALAQARAQGLLGAFDGGVLVLDERGVVVLSDPAHPELMARNLALLPFFQNTRALRRPTFSDIFREVGSGEEVIVVAVPILKEEKFAGLISGAFYIRYRRLGDEVLKLKVGEEGLAYLVDRNGRVIYHPDPAAIGQDLSRRLAVDRLMHAEEGALISNEEGKLALFGFAIVPATGWGLVIEEPWAQVVAPIQLYQWLMALVVLAGVALTALVISLGMRRITGPIADLVAQTGRLARGDFSAQVRLGDLREIRELGLAFNAMAEQIARYRAGLRRYVAAITRSQEEERKRIARDLHDDTIQSLIAIGQRIELCRATLEGDEKATAQLGEVRRMVTETIENVRQFSRDLRPLALEDLGLIPALQLLLSDLARTDSLSTNLETEGSTQGLAPDLEVAIYRIVQEALQNVRKHAHASSVTVRANFGLEKVEISVEDDGVGFNVPEASTDLASAGGFGLMGIEERVQLFGGQMKVDSRPGEGTKLHVSLPREVLLPPVP